VRFHQLQQGARFLFRGTVYRKISPLKGESEPDGVQKLIPRSADVSLADGQGRPVPEQLPEHLPSERLQRELTAFLAACERAAARLDPPLTESQRTDLRQAVGTAGQDFLTRLAIGGTDN